MKHPASLHALQVHAQPHAGIHVRCVRALKRCATVRRNCSDCGEGTSYFFSFYILNYLKTQFLARFLNTDDTNKLNFVTV